MSKIVKSLLITFGVIAAISIGIFVLLFVKVGVNKNDTKTEEKANTGKPYALVEIKKSDIIKDDDPSLFTLRDDHTFISKVRPILAANSGKSYTTITFGDGTGICFPSSSFTYTATYGEIDKKGIIKKELYYISVAGNTVSVTTPPDSTNDLSQAVFALIPDKYLNDSTYVSLNEGTKTGEIHFAANTKDLKGAAQEIMDAIKDKIPDDMVITWTANESTTFTSTGSNFQ